MISQAYIEVCLTAPRIRRAAFAHTDADHALRQFRAHRNCAEVLLDVPLIPRHDEMSNLVIQQRSFALVEVV